MISFKEVYWSFFKTFKTRFRLSDGPNPIPLSTYITYMIDKRILFINHQNSRRVIPPFKRHQATNSPLTLKVAKIICTFLQFNLYSFFLSFSKKPSQLWTLLTRILEILFFSISILYIYLRRCKNNGSSGFRSIICLYFFFH